MNIQNSLTDFNSLIGEAKQITVLIGGFGPDDLGAGVSLALSLEAAGKKVTVFGSQTPSQENRNVWGAEKVRTDFGQKDLLVVFDYPLENIEKVSSQEEGEKLKLIVKIKGEADPIRTDQVKVISQDADFDLGILIGKESAFPNLAQFVSKGNWIWLGQEGEARPWAQISLIERNASYSEMIARIIQGLGLPLSREIAGNLYEGIKGATSSFANLTSYKTLETAALCLKVIQGNGGQGKPIESAIILEEIEKKEGGLPTPKIFKGATTPRV